MPYAGYLLNPGDMFQVDVDRVLFATGAPKTPDQIRRGRKLHRAQRRANKANKGKRAPKKRNVTTVQVTTAESAAATQPTMRTPADIVEIRKQRRLDFKELLKQAEASLEDKRSRVGAKRKIELRAFVKEVKNAMSTVNRKNEKELDAQLTSLVSRHAVIQRRSPAAAADTSEKGDVVSQPPELSPEEQRQLREAIVHARENPIDESKPYATPWRPRPYMSAFAFIPRYLEVNPNICAAVYLRHPVARPGLAEVPSPFEATAQQLAFSWYLRRR
jgi:hypothetical protein